MINATESFINAINADSRHFVAKILKDNVEIPCDIKSIKGKKQAFGDTELAVGSVTSAQVEIVADGVNVDLENEDIEVRIGVTAGTDGYLLDKDSNKLKTDDGNYLVRDFTDFIRIGYFTVTKFRASTFEAEIQGVGYISSKLGDEIVIPEDATLSLANIAAAIQNTSGVPVLFKDGIDSSGIIRASLSGMTCRDALEIITSVTGGFAAENADGGIEIHKYQISASPLSVTADRVLDPPTLAELDYEMTGITVAGKNGVFSSGDSIKQRYENDYMTADLFTGFAQNIVGYTYRPGEVPIALGDPRLEPWDTLLVTDLNGDTYNVPCHQIQFTFDGGLMTDVIAIGESEAQQEVRTPLMKRIDAIEEAAAVQDALIAALERQIDGKIETWARASDPSTGWPASERETHVHDLWLYTGTEDTTAGGVEIHSQGVYEYVFEDNAYKWQAYSSTSDNLFDLADGKATVYPGTYPFENVTDPHENDIAIDTGSRKIYRFNGEGWVEVDNYTLALSDLREDLEKQIDRKIETYRIDTDPFAGELVADLEPHDGDLWFYTGQSSGSLTHNATYRYDHDSETGTTHVTASWVECNVSEAVFDEIDGKSTIYYGTPSELYPDVNVGDYLVDSTDGSTYRWTGSAWVVVTDYMTPINSQVVLEVTYSVNDDTATFNAFVYIAGLPSTEQFADGLFQWFRKTEDYTNYPTGKIPIGSGKNVTVDLADMEYGGVVRCEFNYQVEAYLVDESGNNLVTKDGAALIAAA